MKPPKVCARISAVGKANDSPSSTWTSQYSFRNHLRGTLRGYLAVFLFAAQAVAAPITLGVTRSITYVPSPPASYGLIEKVAVTDKYVGTMAFTVVGTPPFPRVLNIWSASSGELLHTLALPPQVGHANNDFGSSVAIHGELAVVGASIEHVQRTDGTISSNAGAAYIFDLVSGQLLHRLVSDNPRSNDLFGDSVAIHGDKVAIGATGRAFLFDAKTGQQVARVDAPPGRFSETFRTRVAISDSALLTLGGRYGEFLPESVVFSYDLLALTQPRELAPTDVELPRGPQTIAIDGSHAVITRYDFNFGAAYVFDASTGNQLSTIKSPFYGRRNDGFGASVDISDGLLLVGAPGAGGAAYLYDWTTGQLLANLFRPPQTVQFGGSVALSDRNAVVGTGPALGGPNAAYQYELIPEPTSALLAVGTLAIVAALRKRCVGVAPRGG